MPVGPRRQLRWWSRAVDSQAARQRRLQANLFPTGSSSNTRMAGRDADWSAAGDWGSHERESQGRPPKVELSDPAALLLYWIEFWWSSSSRVQSPGGVVSVSGVQCPVSSAHDYCPVPSAQCPVPNPHYYCPVPSTQCPRSTLVRPSFDPRSYRLPLLSLKPGTSP